MKAKKKTTVAGSKKSKQLSLFDQFGEQSADVKSYLVAMHQAKRKADQIWKGENAVPPGSLVDKVIQEFKLKTNIALEIPFTICMHYISTLLSKHGVTIKTHNQTLTPEFWSIILASSGAGKTFSEKIIKKAFGNEVPQLQSGAVSSARWFEDVSKNPQSLWIKDEFLQFLLQIEKISSPLSEMKGYLLQAYDGDEIRRTTKKEDIVIENPRLSFLALNATEPFARELSEDSLVDGFSQRFAYVLAKTDPNRPWQNYPMWDICTDGWLEAFSAISGTLHQQYTANAKAQNAFEALFRKGGNVEESFFRRIMYRAHKYALIYHIISGNQSNEINEIDYAWAERLITLQLADACELIEMCSENEMQRTIIDVENFLRNHPEKTSARDVVIGVKNVKNVQVARFIFDVLGVGKK